MKIRCIAIDDEPLALNKIKKSIGKIPYMELTGAFLNTSDAQEVLDSNEVDVIFIDINMPDINGLKFIQSLSKPPMVVFVTAYSEYALESYSVSAIDYLLKPYGIAEFEKTAEKIHRQWMLLQNGTESKDMELERNTIYLKTDYRHISIKLSDIVYIEGQNEYLKVHHICEPPFLTHMSFAKISEKLPEHFIQIHRSYLVNMQHVKSASLSQVTLHNGTQLPIGKKKREALVNYLASHSL